MNMYEYIIVHIHITMTGRLAIILFGATGFTGRRTIPELYKLIKSENLLLTWGIAGRSEEKLKGVLMEAEKKTGSDFKHISIITANINDEISLAKMSAKANVIINTTGPFRFCGEAIVKACLATGTHYIDVCGEPEFMENMQLKYHKEAMKKGIYLISSCGIDSIPSDLGAIFMMKNFVGTLNSIESYMYLDEVGGPYPGPVMNYTTWESAVHGLANINKLIEIRSQLFSKKLPQCKPKLQSKKLFKNKITGRWALPFPGADRSVMQRTQRYLYELYDQRPVQIQCYHDFENVYNAFFAILIGSIFSTMCKYEWSRSLLLKNPKLFSMGVFTLEGPTEEKQENSVFHLYLEGKGWDEKLSKSTDQPETSPSKTILLKITTRNPAYGATCTAAVLSAITILTENDKMPNNGGCFPPGVAFANTSLIEKLDKYGMKFELLSKL